MILRSTLTACLAGLVFGNDTTTSSDFNEVDETTEGIPEQLSDSLMDLTMKAAPSEWSEAIMRIRVNGLPLLMANSWKDNRPYHYRYTIHPEKFRQMTQTTPYSVSCGIVVKPDDTKTLEMCPNLVKRALWYINSSGRPPRNTIRKVDTPPADGKIQDEFFIAPNEGYCGANFELVEYVMTNNTENRYWVYYPPNEEGKTEKGYPEIANMKFARSIGWVWKYPFYYENLYSVLSNITKTSKLVFRFIAYVENTQKHVHAMNKANAQTMSGMENNYMQSAVGLVMPSTLYEENPDMKSNCPHLFKVDVYRKKNNGSHPNYWYGYQPQNLTEKYEVVDSHYCAPFRGYCGAYLEVFNLRTVEPSDKVSDVLITSDDLEASRVVQYNKRFGHPENPFGKCFIWEPDRRITSQWRTAIMPLLNSQPLVHANHYKSGANKGFHIYTINQEKQDALKERADVQVGIVHGKVIDADLLNGRGILKMCPELLTLYLYQEVGGKGRTHIGTGKPRVKGDFKLEGTYYCAPYFGYCGADKLLWQLSNHEDNKDLVYTTNRSEAKNSENSYPSYAYRICYIWDHKYQPDPSDPNVWKAAIKRIRGNGLPLLMAPAYKDKKARHFRYTIKPSNFLKMTHITPSSLSCGLVGNSSDDRLLNLCPKLKKMVIWLNSTNGLPINTIDSPENQPAGAVVQDEFYISPTEGYCGANFELIEFRKTVPEADRNWYYYPPNEELKTVDGYYGLTEMTQTRSIGWIWKYSPIYSNLSAITEEITKTSMIYYRFLTTLADNYQHAYTPDQKTAQQYNAKYFLEYAVGLLLPENLYKANPSFQKDCPHLIKVFHFQQATSTSIPNNWYGYNPPKETGPYNKSTPHYCAPFRGYCGAYLEVFNVRTSEELALTDNLILADEGEMAGVLQSHPRYQYPYAPFGRCFVWTPDTTVLTEWKNDLLPVVRSTQPVIQANGYNSPPNIDYFVYTVDSEKQKELELSGTVMVLNRIAHLLDAETKEGKEIRKTCPSLLKVDVYQEASGRQRTHIGSRPPMVSGDFVKEKSYYCAPYSGYCGATEPLYQLSANDPDTEIMYTAVQWEATGSVGYGNTHIICFVWKIE